MTRATATVLFTDLVGSTELRSRLGEEAADELRRKHDRLLAEAVEGNNGRVVKGLGDGIMATFAGASDAVAAAIAIQQGIDRLNRCGKAPVPLAVRAGLSAGDVAFEDDDVHGTPVIEASRLCAAAVGGEILASEVVRWLGGAQGALSLTPVGSLELKGLAAPVPTVRIDWEPAPASPIPMPALLTDIGRIFVGRDAELERLGQLWNEAAAGHRRVGLLAGEPGVGKTRLAAELANRVHDDGGTVLAGRCDEDLGVPYQPFVEALRHFVDHTPVDLSQCLGRYGGELTRLLPELAERVPDLPPAITSDAETERYRLFDAVAAWLAAASADEPFLLVLDDLQWAAKPTLLLMRHLARSAEALQLLIIGTVRDTELHGREPLREVIADLRRSCGIERLALAGLAPSAVATFMAQTKGRHLDDHDLALARAVWEETGGNPFFVREVFRHLSDRGTNTDNRPRKRVDAETFEIPDSVRDVIERRTARLSEDANRALRVAAVAGHDFDLAVVGVAGGFDEDKVVTALDTATAARLVHPVSARQYRFAHALVRDTIYGEISEARRALLHCRVAEALETVHADRLDEHLPALAYHFVQAGGEDWPKAVDYATRAGDRAMAQLAFEAAADHYQQAIATLDVAPGDTDRHRARLLVSLAKARTRAGDGHAADTYLAAAEQARRTGDVDTLAGAALGMADLWSFSSSVDDTRIALLEEARDALGASGSVLTAQVLARLATQLYTVPGSWDRRERLSAEAVEVARHLDDPLTLAVALYAQNYALWAPGSAEERLARGQEIVDLAQRGGDAELVLQGHAWCQIALLELGDVAGFDVELDAYDRLAEDVRQPRYRWYAKTRRAMRALLAGRLDAGERMVREGRALGREAGEPDAENVFSTQMFLVWQERPCEEALQVFDATCKAAEATLQRESPLVIGLQAMRLLLLVDTPAAEDREVKAFLDSAMKTLDPTVYGMGWAILAVLLSNLAARRSVPDASAALYDLLLPHAGLNVQNCGAVAFHGSYAHHLGNLASSLARWDHAEEHFAAAARTHDAMGARAYLATTRLEWARMLLRRRQPGDAERARELLGEALATARELGLRNLERGAVEMLQ